MATAELQLQRIVFNDVVMRIDPNVMGQKLSSELNVSAQLDDEDKSAFMLSMVIKVSPANGDANFLIEVKAVALFTSTVLVTEALEENTLVRVNAPAMAYPYLRAFISNLMQTSGYSPFYLPSINFITRDGVNPEEATT